MNDDESSLYGYVAQFRVHQEFVQAHLKGTLNDEQPLLPTFFPPSSYWISHEKNLFFHGLAVYSRLRPDLIAESIKTKSIFDVCLYLDILQTASSKIPSQIHDSFRSSLEPAMEVPSRWIEREERIATELIQLDSCAWDPQTYSPMEEGLATSNNNLDIFHLSSLARFMSLHDSTRPLDQVPISADTIQLLVAIVTEFISEVVHSSVTSKEQEIRLKGALKVWKYDREEITVRNVRETLKTMGLSHLNLKDYLARLVGEGNDDISSPDPSIDMKMGDQNDDGRGEDNDKTSSSKTTVIDPSNVSEQSTAAEPSPLMGFWLPGSHGRCFLPKHIRVSEDSGDLLPEIDEIELGRELKEEEELDARDSLTSKDFEAGL